MDVRCSRCSTEYDFDDALISERGTTVKCTNCGFQFKVFPDHGVGLAPERWVVRTSAGREIVYTSLRELERGIADKQVTAQDLLSRGDRPPRPLSSIAELEPFFPAEGGSKRGEPSAHEAGSLSATLPFGFDRHPPETAKQAAAPPTEPPPAPPTDLGLRPSGDRGPASFRSRDMARETPRPPSSSRLSAFDSTLEPPGLRAPVSSPRNLPLIEVAGIRHAFRSYDELHDPVADSRRAHVVRSRWIAAVVLLGLIGLLASTVGRRYLARLSGGARSEASSDARVEKFLGEGNRAIDEGDFETAKEQLDKAAALAEKDPAVLAALARLETFRADLWWLRLRLLEPSSRDLNRATSGELGLRVGKAQSAVDRAFAIAPEDPVVLRARVDALRLSGDSDKAREWIAPLSANPGDPENAYVLAALDLAEPSPPWPSLLDRLRTAAAAEQTPGRARATLVYALSRAGLATEARSEFEKMDGRPKPHPLLEELRAFLARAEHGPILDAGVESKGGAPDAGRPKYSSAPAAEDLSDFRARLSAANGALRRGDLARAEQLFNALVEEEPSNTDALSGLAELAKAKSGLGGAADTPDANPPREATSISPPSTAIDTTALPGDR